MNSLEFYKMSGSGNDFIIIDNRQKIVSENNLSAFIKKICQRKLSVGADGFILVENSDKCDFKWQFYNSDGSRAEMCGNGARCAARFAEITGICTSKLSFETDVGIVYANISDDRVKIKMTDPEDMNIDYSLNLKKGPLTVSSINTGVPHVVIIVDNINKIDLLTLGKEIRYHKHFAPAGTNVNLIFQKKDKSIVIRTYERGVEGETLACGTGSVAGAIIFSYKNKIPSPIGITTKSGEILNIYFTEKIGRYTDIYLEGDARLVYKGKLYKDAWNFTMPNNMTI